MIDSFSERDSLLESYSKPGPCEPVSGPRTEGSAPLAAVLCFALLAVVSSGSWAQPPLAAPDDVAAPPADAERSESGLAWKLLAAGNGGPPPDANDLVKVHFTGWTPQGQQFQTSHHQEVPTTFNLQTVFAGWQEAMQLMVIGDKRRFWIPKHLGPKASKGNLGDAVFDVEMVGIIRIPNAPENPQRWPENAESTPSGAWTVLLEKGEGDEYPGPESAVLLHYIGWTTDGKTFDSSLLRSRPTAFPLDKVMPAFAEVVQAMLVGEKRRVWIPEHLAAANWTGSPKGMLIFEVKLTGILPEGALAERKKPETGSD